MEEQEYCDVCGVGEYCGYLFIPCTHKLCEECKGMEVRIEKCPRCNTKVVDILSEDETMEAGNFENEQMALKYLEMRVVQAKHLEQEIIDEMTETQKKLEERLESLKALLDMELVRLNKKLEKKRCELDTSESKLGLFRKIAKRGKRPKRVIEIARTSISRLLSDKFPESTSITNDFNHPYALASNSKGHILICDSFNHRIQILEQDGTFVKSFGSFGNKPGQFNVPIGIATDYLDNIYVTDSDNNRIQIFNNDGSETIKIIGRDGCKHGIGNGEFNNPKGIFINPQNQDILVVDSWNHRFQIFDKDCNFIRKFGSHGKGKGELDNPIGITVNSQNQISVSEYVNGRIQIFDYEGNHLRFIDCLSVRHNTPFMLCIDCFDNLYVGSGERGLPIRIFGKEGNWMKSLNIKKNGILSGVGINNITGSLMVTDIRNDVVYIY